MPRMTPFCLPRPRRLLATLLLCAAAQMAGAETQKWSVHAFGFKVGELNVAGVQSNNSFSGSGSFQTTGLAGALRRIRFTAQSQGTVKGTRISPTRYAGFIDTGKRVSETTLAFSGTVPRKTAGAQKPATPISNQALRGAVDPMTMMWLTLRDHSTDKLCTLGQTQYDGTRLVRITLKSRQNGEGKVTCSGTYDRIGGYSAEELAELKTSPLAIVYTPKGDHWRASEVYLTSRHGKAKLVRRD
ncbi:DUF3108 domain-containing protein [Shimia sagamensis]|uniref:DUF3108 domain-containing protein n=1 Tax=Shimia sagamensis TaxID=1566352 RepID=A0ABY1P437_9RHOB|nr:DUF3108 domain-containing protein [Shimia sagamensis]SMP25249.1 Protein of unknown function [Shimia sagamensis]